MDIKFQVSKLLKNGGDIDDWLDLIGQLKNSRTDRDLLLQIYTVALKNLKKEPSVGYKKLMVGLANLQSETSLDLARETYLDAKTLDLDCAIVCVYHAQFEYVQQHKEKARHIIHNAKKNGCVPKKILRQAYQNWRQNKSSLLDGINDPWNAFGEEHTDDNTDTGSNYISDTTTEKKDFGQSSTSVNATVNPKGKTLPLPIRASSKKSRSASNIWAKGHQTPQQSVKSTIVLGSGNVKCDDKENKRSQRYGPGLSPFMKTDYSPLVKRNSNFDKFSADGGIFAGLFRSSEKCPFVTPTKNMSRSSGEYISGEDACGSSDSCTSDLFITNVLKESTNSYLNNKEHILKKSISSPCLLGNRRTLSTKINSTSDSDFDGVIEKDKVFCEPNFLKNSMKSIDANNAKVSGNNFINEAANEKRNVETSGTSKTVKSIKTDIHNPNDGTPDIIQNLCNISLTKTKTLQYPVQIVNNFGDGIKLDSDHLQLDKVKKPTPNDVNNSLMSSNGDMDTKNKHRCDDGAVNSSAKTFDNVDNIFTHSGSHESKYSTPHKIHSMKPPKNPTKNVDSNLNVKVNHLNNINVDKQNMGSLKKNEIEGNNQTITPKFNNVFATNMKKKEVDTKVNKSEVNKNNQVHEYALSKTNKEHESTLDKLTEPSDLYGEVSLKGNDGINDSIRPLASNVYPRRLLDSAQNNHKSSPVSYTVKGVRYSRKRVLGKGGSCKVYEVLSEYGEGFALKKVNLHDVDENVLNMYTNEIKWLVKMKGNVHIIKLFEWEFKDDNLFLVLEKGDTDLAHTLKNQKNLPKEDMKNYWKQMITAVNVIHNNGIIHADLKPANFLLVGNILKLIDFGIANSIQDNKTSVTRECQMGTFNYMSPEALVQDGCRISRASDVWSLGCILYFMIYKKTPYSDIKNQYARFVALQQRKPIDFSGIDDRLLLDCLQGCLKHDKIERYTMQQLLVHPFLK